MQNKEATVLAKIYISTKDWLIKKYGEQKFLEFLERLPISERGVWTRNLLTISRVPANDYKLMSKQITDFYGLGDSKVFKDAAAEVAKIDLSTVMKIFMKLGSPKFIADKLPNSWGHYFD